MQMLHQEHPGIDRMKPLAWGLYVLAGNRTEFGRMSINLCRMRVESKNPISNIIASLGLAEQAMDICAHII